MKVFITGICGFVGSSIAIWLRNHDAGLVISGMDSFVRPGSETNRSRLKKMGISVSHGDIRCASDFEGMGAVDWVIDAAANPSVLAGVDGVTSSRQLLEHNLIGTINILEYCKRVKAGLVLLSTSRVYSIAALAAIPLRVENNAYAIDALGALPAGVSLNGIQASFSTQSPVSLYGSTKLASEQLALEYSAAFSFPVWINRCGVLAGAGQFGTAEQGIFSYWIHAYAQRRPLRYIGFSGAGHQVRDALHPADLSELIRLQMNRSDSCEARVSNVGGGLQNAMSLAQLSAWCGENLGKHPVKADPEQRPFDIPWVVMDNGAVSKAFNWAPKHKLTDILAEIAAHAKLHPEWLALSGGCV
jgi:CDP-paratose 2-epimerase